MNKDYFTHVFIIAEAGVNHNGSFAMAKQLIDAALDAQVDAVKFQTFIAENVVSSIASKAEYQKKNTGFDESQMDMIKKLQLSFEDFIELKKYCHKKGIQFLSSPFDLESIVFLKTLNLGIWKIPSGEITNLPYLKKIGSYNDEVIISTGMSDMDDIANALKLLIDSGTDKDKITLLHCNTEYPTPIEDVNLNAMLTLKKAFGIDVGYSDHTIGIEVPIAAVSMGATVIEKHFTLDKTLPGPDHCASLDTIELQSMVKAIRNIEKALGDGVKRSSFSEIKNKVIVRKSIHIKLGLAKGHLISEDDLIMKRPGDGISPMQIHDIVGRKVKSDLVSDHKLSFKDIE